MSVLSNQVYSLCATWRFAGTPHQNVVGGGADAAGDEAADRCTQTKRNETNTVQDEYPEDGYESDPPVMNSTSSLQKEVITKHGGGLGTPTGAKTNINGFSEVTEALQSVMNKDGLGWPAKKTLDRLRQTPEEAEANEKRLEGAVKTILECLGEDPEREGLKDTPKRYARALLWMTKGYEEQLCGT